MDISAGIYEEITGLSVAPPVDEADYERRRHQRVPFGFRATVVLERKGGESSSGVVMVRDISPGGLSILNDEPLKPGTVFLMEFRGRDDRAVQIRCMVSRCQAGGLEGTEYIVGATFEELLTEELKPTKGAEEKLVGGKPDGNEGETNFEFDASIPEFRPEDAEAIEGEALSDEEAVEAIGKNPESKVESSGKTEEQPEAAPVRAGSLFMAPSGKPARTLTDYPMGDEGGGEPRPATTPAAAQVVQAATFKVIPLDDAPPAAEIAPAPAAAPVSAPRLASEAGEAHSALSAGKTHEVLARVKELLVRQEETIKSQQRQLTEERERASKELEALRVQVGEMQQQMAQLRARTEADDSAIAELESFLVQHQPKPSSEGNAEAA